MLMLPISFKIYWLLHVFFSKTHSHTNGADLINVCIVVKYSFCRYEKFKFMQSNQDINVICFVLFIKVSGCLESLVLF